MKRFLLFGMVLLGLVSCQEEPLEEFIQEDPDIMIYWSHEYHPWHHNTPEHQFMEMLIGEDLPAGERFYWAWEYDYSCNVLDNYMAYLQNDHPAAESPYRFFAEGLGQAPHPDYIMFRNGSNGIESNDFLECTFPWGATPWNTVKHPVEWYTENGFTVYEIN